MTPSRAGVGAATSVAFSTSISPPLRATIHPIPASHAALDDFEIFAGDGHFHAAASHDQRDYKGRKTAVGHLYTLNLRNFTCNHLALSNKKEKRRTRKTEKNHDITLLKSLDRELLRQGAPKGRKVIYVWDKAGIDFAQWFKWKQAGGIYFLSLEKDNMRPVSPMPLGFDTADPVNAGVISDELAGYGGGVMLRRITYRCPQSGRDLVLLTNLTSSSFPPGLIAQLYRMRWDIEKIFDVFKNKLGEIKAWGSTEAAREMQALFITLSHNLLTRFEETIREEEGIENTTNRERMDKRLEQAQSEASQLGGELPRLYKDWQRLKQTGVTFIRWLRNQIFKPTSWVQSLHLLRQTYAIFKA
ncbi:MAG: transposase [Akkermansiaceae bacterium]|nr:transposase [Akkermansiaceae bacterium]MCP5538254.1 transposase [Akkermansiaceae bacterium]